MLSKFKPMVCLAFTGGLFAASAVHAENDRPPISAEGQAGVDLLMEPFFRSVQSGDATKAYADLFKGTLLESKTTEIGQLAAQTTFVTSTYGAISGWEVVKSECVTPDFCKIVYILRAAEGPIGFWIYAYRQPEGRWEPNYVLMGTTPQFFFD